MNHLHTRKNILYALTETASSIALVFLSYKIVIHLGGLAPIGLWSTVYAAVSIIRFADVGLSASLIKFVSDLDQEKEIEQIKRYIETSIIANGVLFLVIGSLAYLPLMSQIDNFVQQNDQRTAETLVGLIIVGFVLFNISTVTTTAVAALHKGYIKSITNIASNILYLVVVAALFSKISVKALAIAQIAQYVTIIALNWIAIRQLTHTKELLPSNFCIKSLRQLTRFSLHVQATSLLAGLFEPISKLIVARQFDTSIQGTYELAYKTIFQCRALVVSGCFSAQPSLVSKFKQSKQEFAALHDQIKRRTAIACATLFTVLLATSPVISILWIGSLEKQYIYTLAILTAAYLANTISAPTYLATLSIGSVRTNLIGNIITLVLLLLLLPIPGGSISFASMTTLIGFALTVGAVYIRRQGELEIRKALGKREPT